MNELEARETIQTMYKGEPTPTQIDALKIAYTALDKQIPEKPIEKHYEDEGEPLYIKICCPNGCPVQVSKYDNYCCKCGQKLDWDIDR